jgi:hypothetical protein
VTTCLAGSYVFTDTACGPGRAGQGDRFAIAVEAADEEAARVKLYERLVDVIAPAIFPQPLPAALPGYKAACLSYLTHPRQTRMADLPVKQMSWAWAEHAPIDSYRARRRQVAARLVRECRIDGALDYRVLPQGYPIDPRHLLDTYPIPEGRCHPSDPSAVLILGTADACMRYEVPW